MERNGLHIVGGNGKDSSVPVSFADTGNFDSFSRLRISSAHSLFDSQFTYNLQPLLFEQITSGTGATITHDTTNRVALMTFASTPTGGKSFMQTYEHFRYTSGKSQLLFMTFNMNGGVANIVKFAGYSDGTEGIEFQMNGTTPQFKVLSTTSNATQTVVQSAWNLDKLDGSGSSGITINFTKAQILVIDLQALYVGRVRVGFDIDGKIYYCHEFKHANSISYPYFKTANLPIRCGMTCTGTVSSTMWFICSTISSEDGHSSSEGFHFSQDGIATAASGARTHILSLRPRTTFNSIINRTKFIMEDINIVVTGTNPVKWELCLGVSLSGTTTFNDVNTTYSTIQYNTAGTLSGSPTIVMASGYCGGSGVVKGTVTETIPFKYPICLDAAGSVRSLGTISLLVTGLGGNSACQAVIDWKEIR